MQPAERDKLLLVLAITSGSADAWSYIGLGRAFVANMTGNTVLLGIAIFGEHHDILHPLIALVFYAIGAAIGSFFTRRVIPDSIWDKSVSGVLFLEAILLIFSEAAWMRTAAAPSPSMTCAFLACIATAIGLQSGSMLSLKLPGIVTTYISGTWTILVSGLVQMDRRRARLRENRANFEERLFIQITFLITYFLSAVAAGCAFRYVPVAIGIITALPILIAAAYSSIREWGLAGQRQGGESANQRK
ncbi:MAG TPA: YoaK family protein [Candidatus Binataceae bacterium]|nr:YoaK family protein [Candidatus Binataceae bacterium]